MIGVRHLGSANSRGLRISLLSAILAGAVTGGGALRAHTGAAATSTTLRIWYGTEDATEVPRAHQLAQRFMAQHRSIHVTLTTYNLNDLNDKMQLALNTNTPPDLIYTTPRGPGLPAYVRAGKLLDLTSAARQRGWAAQLRPGLLAEYNRLLAANGGRRDAGHTYAVPYDLAAVAVMYNKTLFAKLHLEVPHTLAALEAVLPRIKRAGMTPLGLGNADGWLGDDWWLTLVNASVPPSSLEPALRLSPSFSFNRPIYRQAAATLRDWARRGYFTHDFGGLDAQDGVEAFFEGQTAMQLVSSTENSQILSLVRARKLNVGVFPFPSARAGQPPVMLQSGYEGWAIPRAAHNPTAALDFISYVTSTQTAALLLAHGMLPAHRLDVRTAHTSAPFQRDYLGALNLATPGVYLDAAPIPNINATMEANIQLLLQGYETPAFLPRSLQQVYASRGAKATSTRTDGEF
jgi:raffinose/stachyose/melibiose transport system substrate-binding protein